MGNISDLFLRVFLIHSEREGYGKGEGTFRGAYLNRHASDFGDYHLIFRSLGVHVSKVRSLTLDAWEPEQIKVNCTNESESID